MVSIPKALHRDSTWCSNSQTTIFSTSGANFCIYVANINQTMKLTITEEKHALSGRTGGSEIGWICGRLQKQKGSWCEDEAVLINTFCGHRWQCQRENFLYHPLLYILCKITKFSMLDKQSKKVGAVLHFVVRFLIFWPWAFCIVGVSLSFFLSTFFLFFFFFFFSSFGEAYSSFLAFLCKNWMRKWNSVAACWKSFCRETEYN